jgi:glycosyltransferase involved in cell wall biosynthesis
MNIVYFVTEDSYFLSHRLPVALHAKECGHNIYVATKVTSRKKEIEDYGFKLIPLNLSRTTLNFTNDIFLLFKLVKVLRVISANIIHNVAIKPIIVGSLASLFCKNISIVNAFTGMGFLFTSKLSIKYRVLRFFVWLLLVIILKFRNTNSIVQNQGDFNFLVSNFYAKTKNICLIGGSGVDTNFYKPKIKKLEKDSKNIRIITTCRMLKDKGVLDFYEAALILKNRGVPCSCVFVGGLDSKNPSSIGSNRLKKWIDDGIIEYHEHTDEILTMLYESDIFILVSYREGLSKSILEAASIGMPIVSSDIDASKNLVIHNENGFLVPVKNAFDIANAIEKLVFDDDLRNKFGARSRNIVLNEFSEKVVCKKTLDFYHEVVL